MTKFNFLLPLYNDWQSCSLLIKKINSQLKRKKRYADILILDDASTQKFSIRKNYLSNINKIRILRVKQNLGSQKIINIGLNFLKTDKNKVIIIMDSDGEDDVNEINNLIDSAIINSKQISVASRVKRKESLFFKILYKIHLLIVYTFTFKWISFGNYSAFNSNNIKKIVRNEDSWLAFSSCISKNCEIIKINTVRQKRYFGKSKLSFFALFSHSLRIMSVYQKKIFLISILYIILFLILFPNFFNIIIILALLVFLLNFLIYLEKKNHKIKYKNKKNYVDKIIKIK